MEHSPIPNPMHKPTQAFDDTPPASPQDGDTSLSSQDGMTQASFDRLTSVVSANECTGLIPSIQVEDSAEMFGELGGSMLQGERSQPQ